MTTTTGKQGDYQLIKDAYSLYWDVQGEDKQVKRDLLLFVVTWSDTLGNLSKLFTRIKKDIRCPKILAQEITPVIRKGNCDVFVMTENNILFREIYKEILNQMILEYN